MALGAFIVAATLLALTPLEHSQAQLYLDIFPSQDNTNATLWVFSGSVSQFFTHRNAGPNIPTSGSFDRGHTTKTDNALFQTGTTTTSSSGVLEALTPLRTASATNAPLDFESLRTRLGQTIKLGTTNTNDDITIPNTATNAPTISIATKGSRTIANMYFRDVPNTGWDDIGPRVSSTLDYRDNNNTRRALTWSGAAIMTNKPISHFNITTPGTYLGNRPHASDAILGGFPGGDNNLRIRIHGSAIPEPEEYALIFALFALGFVFFHRRRLHKKKRQDQAATTIQ